MRGWLVYIYLFIHSYMQAGWHVGASADMLAVWQACKLLNGCIYLYIKDLPGYGLPGFREELISDARKSAAQLLERLRYIRLRIFERHPLPPAIRLNRFLLLLATGYYFAGAGANRS